MGNKPNKNNSLRAAAEAQFARDPPTEIPAQSAEELLHELRVHQIELEMQNDELRRAQLVIEESRDRYVDLYEFAPTGYLTLTREGMIAEANLTAAAMLGVERNRLINRRFASFVSKEDSDRWYRHFMDMLQHEGRRSCELALRRGDDSFFHARVDCLRADGASPLRIALTDISERKHAEQQLRELSAHLNTVREEEKASFAREIHDDLGGTLTALKMDAYWLARKLAADQTMDKTLAPLLERVESMSGLIDSAVHATRRIITDLRPTIIDDLGLLAALEWQAEQFHKHTGTECIVVCAEDNGGERKLDKAVSINLFRIFQETLTNVARHSGASRVDAELRHGGEVVVLSISDNGRGLPDGHTVAPTSYGVRGMCERVEQLGGRINFNSPTGGGFSVEVILPLPAAS